MLQSDIDKTEEWKTKNAGLRHFCKAPGCLNYPVFESAEGHRCSTHRAVKIEDVIKPVVKKKKAK